MPESAEPMASARRVMLGGVTPILRVKSLDNSVAYYVEQFGFQLQWRSNPLASVGRDRAPLMLSEGDQGHAGTWVWIAASDVDELWAEFVSSRGAKRMANG